MTAPGQHAAAWARAGTNIALVKYWGKRASALNLPAAGSLSLTLAELGTTTGVRFLEGRSAGDGDQVSLNGQPADAGFGKRVSRFLDLVRARANVRWAAAVTTVNSVPTAAGLASSASGFAALALAASRAAGLDLRPAELSALARQGSGSAARSIFGGFVEMAPGVRDDGTDAVAAALPLDPPWQVRLVVALTASGPKAIGSTAAMERTAASSPFYPAWLASVPGDLAEARAAIAARDLRRLGPIIERSTLRMHATAMAAEPAILYWSPVTLAAIQTLAQARGAGGPEAYFTMDAGPHVKALCRADDAAAVSALLAAVPGVLGTVIASPGPGAQLVAAPDDGGRGGPT